MTLLKRVFKVIADLLVVGLAVSFTYIFVSIKISGAVFAVEPNQVVLWSEIVAGVLLLVIGINRFLDDV